jgi:uroporphyrinogen decarboxylase
MTTDLEAFQDTTAHRRPGRVLYYASFTPDLKRRVVEHIGTDDVGGHYGMFAPAGVSLRPPADYEPTDYSAYWHCEDLPEATTFDSYGVAMVPSGLYHFWGYVSPLREATDLKEIEAYPLDKMEDWDDSHLPAEIERLHAEGRVAACFVGHMYETAWQIRGYEPFLIDTVERPAWAECLLERLFRQNIVKALACARAGADLIFCGDDVANQNAMMFNPDTWRRLIHSRWAKLFRAVKDVNPDVRIKYHSDGNIMNIIPELVDAGLDILNPLQPECLDVDEVHRRYGDRLTFDGCIGTQSTMPFGTPGDVRARVREVIDKYGRDGGLIVAPTHVLEPEVPIENVEALIEAACRNE